MGSDLTYHCLGGNSYEITLSFYRDCAGVEADTQAFIVFQSSCYPADSIEIYQIAGTGQEISPACPNNPTTCNGGTFTGIQEYIYRGVINLPGPCADWQFSYNLCCRNNAITNINMPGQTMMYIYATLDNTITPCNNSPTFSNKPVPFACLGQLFCYNHGAYDQDGDSLVYSLITPYDGGIGNPVNYLNPFSATNPLSSSPGLTLNPLTGDICMTPSSLEITVMAVLVKEYRNGVFIGQVERDIQITVINCNNVIPTLSGINGTNSFSQTVCAGTQTCFTISSADIDASQNTTIEWDYSIPNATFTTFPGSRETAMFCWTPTSAQINSNPYCFTVTVNDDNCPYEGRQIYSYCITVTGLNANAGPDLTVACNTTTPVTANASGGSGIYSYQWNTGETTQSINAGSGVYIVTASDGSCTDTDTMLVAPAAGSPLAAFSTNANCTSLNIQFTDNSTITGGTISSYAWNFGDGTTSAIQNPAHTYSSTGNYQVQLIVTSAGGCIDTITQSLHLSLNAPDALFTLANGCIGSQINFTNQSVSPSAITSWQWYFGDGNVSTVPSPAHIYQTPGPFYASLVVTNIDGCRDSISHPLTVFALPVANAGLNDTVCEGLTAHLTASGGVSYLWNPGTLTTASIALTTQTSQTYQVTVTDINGCSSTDAASVVIAREPQLFLQNQTICAGGNANLTANIQGGGGPGSGGNYTYLWSPGGFTTQQINVNPVVTTDYYVTVNGRYGCTVTDTVTVHVNQALIADAGLDQHICPGDSAILNATGGTNYQWNQGAGNTQQVIVFPNFTTTYNVTVSAPGGCSATDQVDVIIDPPPLADAGIDQAVCIGSSVDLNASGGTNYIWLPGNTNAQHINVPVLSSSTFTVVVTDANGCTASDQVDVLVNPLPVADAGTDQSICIGGTATLFASGGVSYLWTSLNDTSQQTTVSPVSDTNYSVIVTDLNGCSASDNVDVFINQLPTLSPSSVNTLCYGSSDGSASVFAANGVAPYVYLWSPIGGTTANANGLTAGMYYITVTDSNNCVQTESVFVDEPVPLTLIMDSVSAVCFGSATGSATVSVAGGASSYTYLWSTGDTTITVANLNSGNYSVIITDSNGCTQTASVNVPQPTALNLVMTSTATLCYNDSTGIANVVVSGGTASYSYLWIQTGDTISSTQRIPAGYYTVNVTDANGCSTLDSVLVQQPPAINLVTNTNPSGCNTANGSAIVVANGGTPSYNYNWSPGNSTVANPVNLFSGIYSVLVTDNNGCTNTASANIQTTGGPVINASVTQNVSCYNGNDGNANVSVVSGSGPFTYNWNPGNFSNAVETSLAAGSYSIIVRDQNGCISIDSITVSQPPPIAANTSSDSVSCYGYSNGNASVIANGGTAPYSYMWSPSGGTNAIASSLAAGNYSVVITDNNGCTMNAISNVYQPQAINVILSSTPVSCYGDNDGSVVANANGGVAGFNYQWAPTGGQTNIALNCISGNYTVIITDANGCTTSSSTFVDQPDSLSLITSAFAVSCNGGNTGRALVNVTGGTPNYTYNWQPGGNTNANCTNIPTGNYSVIVTDVNGCTSSASTFVPQAGPLTLSVASVPMICIGQTANLSASISGGTNPYSLLWNTNDTSIDLQVSPATTTMYTVSVTDANNCTTSPAFVNVPVYPPLSLNVIGAPPMCEGTAATLHASGTGGNGGPYNYTWNNGAIFGDNPIVIPVHDSTFTAVISDGCSPDVSESVSLTIYPLPEVDFTPHVIAGCTPVLVDFRNIYSPETGSEFFWDLDDNTLSSDTNPVHEYIVPGEYDVTLTIITPEGCADTRTVNNAVTVFGFPVADFYQSADQVSEFQPIITFTDNSSDAISWSWDFGDGSFISDITQPTHEYSDSGTYNIQLIVTSPGGCIDTTYGTVRVEPEFTIYIPNAFTPNGDGVNDHFFATGVGFVDYELRVIDRWGKEIFYSEQKEKQWDGSYFGSETICQNDVYEYIVSVHDYKGKLHKLIGHVTLTR